MRGGEKEIVVTNMQRWEGPGEAWNTAAPGLVKNIGGNRSRSRGIGVVRNRYLERRSILSKELDYLLPVLPFLTFGSPEPLILLTIFLPPGILLSFLVSRQRRPQRASFSQAPMKLSVSNPSTLCILASTMHLMSSTDMSLAYVLPSISSLPISSSPYSTSPASFIFRFLLWLLNIHDIGARIWLLLFCLVGRFRARPRARCGGGGARCCDYNGSRVRWLCPALPAISCVCDCGGGRCGSY